MNKEQLITDKEMVALMIVKTLYDFESPLSPEDTLNDKIEKFIFDEDDEGITFKEYEDGLKKLDKLGIFDISNEEEYELTIKGRALMGALSAMEKLTDDVKRKIMNGTIKVIDFIKENKSEILSIVVTVLAAKK